LERGRESEIHIRWGWYHATRNDSALSVSNPVVSEPVQATIEAAIRRAIPDAEVRVESPDGTHWSAVVKSETFRGMSLVRQHQMVMGALRAEFDTERLHALELRTVAP
jgi:stress-induced morphogen